MCSRLLPITEMQFLFDNQYCTTYRTSSPPFDCEEGRSRHNPKKRSTRVIVYQGVMSWHRQSDRRWEGITRTYAHICIANFNCYVPHFEWCTSGETQRPSKLCRVPFSVPTKTLEGCCSILLLSRTRELKVHKNIVEVIVDESSSALH